MKSTVLGGAIIICVIIIIYLFGNKQTIVDINTTNLNSASTQPTQLYDNFLVYGSEFWGSYRSGEYVEQPEYLSYKDMSHYSWDKSNKTVSRIEYPDYSNEAILITGADYDSFTPLGGRYARDINHLYYRGRQLPYDVALHPKLIGNFIVDDLHVYHTINVDDSHQIITGANPKTFHNLEVFDQMGSSYFADDTTIYNSDGTTLSGTDYDSFQVLAVGFAKDNNNTYRNNLVISGADAATFTAFDTLSPYSKDSTNIYFMQHIVSGADLNTFESIDNEGNAKDINHTYKNGEIVE